ncbi:MAG: multiphosphoryl transfer protein [Actinomycetota bacterium]|nr:multiphosphoryl transfer protein [Actinomycetota bacterium]
MLPREAIWLGCRADGKPDALRQAGAVLTEIGAVEPGYAEAMFEREASISTYMGEGVAIPHGTDASRRLVRRTTLGFLQFPEGVDWGDGNVVRICLPIAARGGEHLALLSALARVLIDPEKAEALRNAADPDRVFSILASAVEEEMS